MLKSFFLTYKIFLEREWLFLDSTSRIILKIKWALWLVSTKIYSISCKNIFFGQVWLPRSSFKVDILSKNFKKSLEHVLRQVVWNIVSTFYHPIFKKEHRLLISIQADMDFRHCFSRIVFMGKWLRVVWECWLRALVHFCSFRNQWRRVFRFIRRRRKNLVCFYFRYVYTHLWTLLPVSGRFYWNNAARSTWAWGA